jgi:hypothetical protein
MGGISVEAALPYQSNGEEKTLPVTIRFISNYVIREYGDIIEGRRKIETSWAEISDLTTELSAMQANGENVEKQKRISDKITQLSEGMKNFDSKQYIEKRSQLAMRILRDNGVKEEMFFNPEFWDEQVDPGDLVEFLELAVYKDIPTDKKKRVLK